ncbi:MAG: hypothetical protein DRG59_02120 [Deltaproteobacteria bacterium]|nr:MAG: hypothetical protein DRG59_02120 [Deltaproteobacteria bacterium]
MEILEGEKLLKRVELLTRIIFVVLVLLGLLIGNFRIALSIFFGGVLIVANFELLKRQLTKALSRKGQVPSKVGLFIKYYARFLILAVIVLILIKKNLVHPIWLLVGLSSVMLGIMGVAVSEFVKIFLKGEG